MIAHVALGVALVSLLYAAGSLACIVAFGRRRTPPGAPRPPAAILKPIDGLDERLSENLCSFCEQDYPAFQIVFCIRSLDDPALPVVRDVLRAYPELDACLVIDPRVRVANPKIANILNALPSVKHDILIVADSDMFAGRTYLDAVVAPFADPAVGAVTCLYCGVESGGVASALGALHINDVFAPSVLVAIALQSLRFCLGATMAVRRDVLAAIGGFETLGGYLADDYHLGRLVRERGNLVALSRHVVRDVLHERSLADLWRHEMRWARTNRGVRPLGYAFSSITYSVAMCAIAAPLIHDIVWSTAVITAALVLRILVHFAARSAFDVRSSALQLALALVRDFLSLVEWAASFFISAVEWRGTSFAIGRGDTLLPNARMVSTSDPSAAHRRAESPRR